jgi:hypothetical protein
VLYLKKIFNGINDIQIFLRIWLSHDLEISNKNVDRNAGKHGVDGNDANAAECCEH